MSRELARSYLYMPGNRPDRFDKACAAGGVEKSGHRRGKGFLALEHMTTTKTVVNFHG